MAMLHHPICLRRLWLTPHFRHGCSLLTHYSTSGFDTDALLGYKLKCHGQNVVFKTNIRRTKTLGSSFKVSTSPCEHLWLMRKCSGNLHRCLHSFNLSPLVNPSACRKGLSVPRVLLRDSRKGTKCLIVDNSFGLFTNVHLSSCHPHIQYRNLLTSKINFEPASKATKNKKLWQEEEEKSKVEEAVEAMKEKKEKLRDKAFELNSSVEEVAPLVSVALPMKKSIWERVKHEAIHYYNGFKLLYFEIKIAGRLLWQVMNGKYLTRRERRQFLRTAADIFRLVPFLVFLLIPFMEFMLPVAIKLFPNMLPSTFEDKSKKEEDKKKQLKVKIQMAKFLQDTVEEMAVTAQQKTTQDVVVEFANFFEKIRSKGEQPSNEDIMRFSKLFEDQITLDSMSRAQLKAINRLLMLPTIGTNNYLRFQLRMKLRQLRTDDLLIQKEGVDSLTVQELQSACQARGMRAIGVPEARLRSQLRQWLELHLDEQIPASLLLMSRALYLPESISKVEQLRETLSQLPETLVEEAEIKICEVSGEKVDNKVRLDVLKKEEQMIAQENEELQQEEEEKRKKIEAVAAEILEDKAPEIKATEEEDISQEDWLSIKQSLALASERDELEKIKEDRVEYQEELRELATEDERQELKESLGSSRLGRKVDAMINQIEKRLRQIDEEIGDDPTAHSLDADGDGKISLQEMISAVRRLKNAPSEAKCQKIAEMLDQDHDGALDLDDVGTVAELLSMEDVDLTAEQIKEILRLLHKETQVRQEANESTTEKETMSSDQIQQAQK